MIFGVIYKLVLVREIEKLRKGLFGGWEFVGWEFVCTQTHTKPYK